MSGHEIERAESKGLSILMICPQFRPIVGGYEQAAERLSAALAERGVRVVVGTERRDSSWLALERADGFEVRRLPCVYRRHFHLITSLLSFARYLFQHGRSFDVWHVHQYGPHAALAVMFGKLLDRPVLLKLTSSASQGIELALSGGLGGCLSRFLHRNVSACQAVSEETRQEAISFGISPARVRLIPNGVDCRRFQPATPDERKAARRSLGLNCERLVLYVGRLSSVKNPLALLEAWSALGAETRKDALLALVGNGPEWESLRIRVQAPDLVGNVHLAGWQSDVAMWYRAADVCVISSRTEGLANTMIEAMAAGLPVISTRVSGASTLLDPPVSGLVVEIGDTEMLACALASLLGDEARRRDLGQNARLKFESRFSLQVLSKQIIELYRNLTNRSGSRGRD